MTDNNATKEPLPDDVSQAFKKLKFQLLRSSFYEADRLAFYVFTQRMMRLLGVVGSVGTLAILAGHGNSTAPGSVAEQAAPSGHITLWVSLLMGGVIVSALSDNLFRLSKKASQHMTSKSRYDGLLRELVESEIASAGKEKAATLAALEKIAGRMTLERARHQQNFAVVDAVARNRAADVMARAGSFAPRVKVRWYQHRLRNLSRLSPLNPILQLQNVPA
jgi:hypothetical protein